MAITETLQALSDPTRREILRLLRGRDMPAGAIANHFRLAKSTLSGHFATLRHAGLIVPERHGASIVYSFNLSVAEETMAAMAELLGTLPRARAARSASRLRRRPA
ncbi:MAG TPA: metalloregulator ArsR/SmtB family transcription factor [Candidatus Binataceae bacterium]|nr:metalloregulator ArsR/SmtB family transcription factor [Candidatus Binataceae bacterium]